MKKLILIIVLFTSAFGYGFAQTKNSLTVTVKDINTDEGTIIVDVFNSQEGFLKKSIMQQKRKATTKDEMIFEFEELVNGQYTVVVVHDENSNGYLDKNFIGMPTEPYGISKNGKNSFGPPSYLEALFAIDNKDVILSISL